MSRQPYNVLFICAGNHARSILAEAILNDVGGGRFRTYSAGSHPKGHVHPMALELLGEQRLPVEGLRSKDWDKFAKADAPRIDFIFTVCDRAGGEACPVWPGRPVTAHWGVRDPAEVDGDRDAQRRAFLSTFLELRRRIELFTSLELGKLDALALKEALARIGRQ